VAIREVRLDCRARNAKPKETTCKKTRACRAASPAWTFLGKKGLPDVPYPADYSTDCRGEDLAFVRRTEGHGYSAHDWTWLMDFCDTLKD